MSVITRIGRVTTVPGHPNCQVDTGGQHCVRREHEAFCIPKVRARQAFEAAARERVTRSVQ